MALNYDPKDAVSTWPTHDPSGAPIEYTAVIRDTEDTTSKSSGKPMQVWTIDVFGPEGQDREIKEYVVLPAATFKIKQLARALGREAEFNAAAFQAEDHTGENFKVHLNIEQQEGFDDKNKISKYLPAEKKADAPGVAPNMQLPPRQKQQSVPQGQPAGVFAEEAQFDPDSIPF